MNKLFDEFALATPRAVSYTKLHLGAWRSLVARLHGVQEVMGSSPVAPTRIAFYVV
jgi:hypothetical protein